MCCLLVVVLFASNAVADVDLTPDTPPAATATFDSQMQVRAPLRNPSTGACNTVYTVQSGDTLSKIASLCGVTLNELVAANPSIANPNFIHPGQEVNIPALVQPGAGVLPTGGLAADAPPPEELPATGQPAAQPTVVSPETTLPSEVTGVKPGDVLTIEIANLPPQVRVRVGVGQQGGALTVLGETLTDQVGRLRTEVTIPVEARAGETWFVAAMTLEEPYTTVNSAPFQIGGLP
jgi:LysM repeat protein